MSDASRGQQADARKLDYQRISDDFLANIEVEFNRSSHGYFLHTAKWLGSLPVLIESGKNDQIIYQRIAVVTFLAFSIEAWLNYLGAKCLAATGWDESKKIEDKLELLCQQFGYELDLGRRPFQSFKVIKSLRDMFAHGKPKVISGNWLQIRSAESKNQHSKRSEEKQLDPTLDFARELYKVDLKRLEQDTEMMIKCLLDASGIDYPDPLSAPSFL